METVEVPKDIWEDILDTLNDSVRFHNDHGADEMLGRIRQHFDGPEESE